MVFDITEEIRVQNTESSDIKHPDFEDRTPDVQTGHSESSEPEPPIETYSPIALFVFSIDFAPSLSSSIMALIASTFSGTTIDS